ncbi:MAG: hypothetical protein IJU05_03015 [Schwartzia sp.]|nr:hypothetical protein [Schwartzia sp. (in: firmicutes)]
MRAWKLVAAALFAAVLGSFLVLAAGRDEPSVPLRVPPFTLRDLAGNEVTNERFARRRVTALTVWRPGVRDCEPWLDAAADISASLPEDAALIGLLVGRGGLPDEAELAAAREIAAGRTGAVTHLVADNSLMALLAEVRTLPVTFFVDGEGRIVGHPLAGGDPHRIVRELRALLDADPKDAAERRRIHTQIFR